MVDEPILTGEGDIFMNLSIGQKCKYFPILGSNKTDGNIYTIMGFTEFIDGQDQLVWLKGKRGFVLADSILLVEENGSISGKNFEETKRNFVWDDH